jgi:cation diffusion facilitator family transporter
MLTTLILKWFVPGFDRELTSEKRTRCGIVSGITGILCNLLLIAVKLVLAALSGSIAVAAEAVNNLTDAGSGMITIAGFHFSNRPADAEHPFGHGRTEYVAGLIVALLVVVLGVHFLKDSITSLFQPSMVKTDWITVTVLSATLLVKLWMFFFYRKVGQLINSDVIKAAAYDSLSDSLGTLIVIGSLIASRYTAFPVDGCAGIAVSLMLLWAGGSVLKDTFSKLLGETPDLAMVEKVRKTLLNCPGIDGVHDIIIHNYGENSYFVTAHAEISNEGDRSSAHDILENAEITAAQKLSIHLLLHGDPHDKAHPEVIFWRSRLENAVSAFDSDFKIYDFKLEKEPSGEISALVFHLLLPRKYAMTEEQIQKHLQNKMNSHKEGIQLNIRFIKSFV